MFFEGENFHKFHESIVIHKNFTLVIFNKISLLKYFKVDKHEKEDKVLVIVIPYCQAQLSRSLTQTIPSS